MYIQQLQQRDSLLSSGAELDLPVNLRFNSYLWSWALGNVKPTGDPSANTEHAGRITYPIWPGNVLGSPLEVIAEEMDVWATLLSLLPLWTELR